MKTTLCILLASLSLASATTITVLRDTPEELEFTIVWGAGLTEWDPIYFGGTATGPAGSTIQWGAFGSRNRYRFHVEIHDAFEIFPNAFSVTFWSDPEYFASPFNPIPTAYGSPNISYGETNFPLDGNPYGARFIYTVTPTATALAAVPEGGGMGWLISGLCLATVGLCGVRRPARRIADAK